MRSEPLLGLALLGLVALSGPWASTPAGAKESEMAYPPVVVGAKAPDFTAPASTGGTISLHDFRGRIVVLYIYPKDETPYCTREACSFRDTDAALRKLGAMVIGVSKDSMASHDEFIRKHHLNFTLVSDPEGKIISLYGAWKAHSLFGKTALGVNRSTFLIDTDGIVRQIWRNVTVKGHDEQVLQAVKALAQKSPP